MKSHVFSVSFNTLTVTLCYLVPFLCGNLLPVVVPTLDQLVQDPSLWANVMQTFYCTRNFTIQRQIVDDLYSPQATFEDAIMIVKNDAESIKVQFHSLIKFFSRVEMDIYSVDVDVDVSSPQVTIRNQQRYYYKEDGKPPTTFNDTIYLSWHVNDNRLVHHKDVWDEIPRPMSYSWYQKRMRHFVGQRVSFHTSVVACAGRQPRERGNDGLKTPIDYYMSKTEPELHPSLQRFLNRMRANPSAMNKVLKEDFVKSAAAAKTYIEVGEILRQISNVKNIRGGEWYNVVKEVLQCTENVKGPAWLGINRPFFANDYKPVFPVSDQLRNRIYEMHQTNKTFWSAGRLALNFGISIARAKAILRLKEQEEKYKSMGLTINDEFVEHMDKVLNADDNFKESEYIKDPIKRSPLFVALEEPSISGVEAARSLRKSMIAKKTAMKIPTDEDEKSLFIRHDEWEKEDSICTPKLVSDQSSHRYVFIDVGNQMDNKPYDPPSDRPILVRECDGTLRHAKSSERAKYGKQLWGDQKYLNQV